MIEDNDLLKDSQLRRFFGTYLGFTPCLESPIDLGELELTVREPMLIFRTATGKKVTEETFKTNDFKVMDFLEVCEQFGKNSDYSFDTSGYKTNSGIKLFFARYEVNSEFAVLICLGGHLDFISRCVLYNEKQVKRGVFDCEIERIEETRGGKLPRIKYGGRTCPVINGFNR